MRLFLTFIFLCISYMSYAQVSFQIPTSCNVIGKTFLKDLYETPDNVENWSVEGTGNIIKVDSYYMFLNDIELVSKTLDGSCLCQVGITLNIRTYGSFNEIYNYTVRLEYEDGEYELKKVPLFGQCKDFKNFTVVFREIKPKNFKLRILSAYSSPMSVPHIYINDISVYGIYVCPSPDLLSQNTSIGISDIEDYDDCIVELYHQVPAESGIDTLFYNNFEENNLKGIVVDSVLPIISNGMLGINTRKNTTIKIPVIPNKELKNLKLSFSSKRINKVASDIEVYYNSELIQSYGHNSYDTFYERSCDIDVQTGNNDTISIMVKYPEDAKGSSPNVFVCFDDIFIYQECEYSYKKVQGYPCQNTLPFYMENLDCSSFYRVRLQFIDYENDNGEKVITNLGDFYVNTTGDFLQLPPGSNHKLEKDFEGTIMISNKADLYGSYVVMGEICYVLEYVPDQWMSVGLPFKPQRIGAFINGEGFYLRENNDFYLRSYDEDINTESYYFAKHEDFYGMCGYILKVPENISFDNNAIYFYSSRKTLINGECNYEYSELYNHVANPYTYSLNYHDTSEEYSGLFGDYSVYRFDGSNFVLFTADDEIEPFESVIVYTGGLNGAPRMIKIIEQVSDAVENTYGDRKVFVYDDGIAISDYSGMVDIWSVSGQKIKSVNVSEGQIIKLEKGNCYLVNFDFETIKIIL